MESAGLPGTALVEGRGCALAGVLGPAVEEVEVVRSRLQGSVRIKRQTSVNVRIAVVFASPPTSTVGPQPSILGQHSQSLYPTSLSLSYVLATSQDRCTTPNTFLKARHNVCRIHCKATNMRSRYQRLSCHSAAWALSRSQQAARFPSMDSLNAANATCYYVCVI